MYSLGCRLSYRLDRAWKCRNVFLWRLYKSSERALLANLLLFRQSGSILIRQLRDRTCLFHNNIRTDSRLIQAQKVLIGGCLISFAQDKITDEEVLNTLKGFSVTCNSPVPCANAEIENSPEQATEPDENPIHKQTSPVKQLDAWDPPLTLFIRKLRKDFVDSRCSFLHSKLNTASLENFNVSETVNKPGLSESLYLDTFNPSLLTILTSLNINPDGSGFVDNTWDRVIDRQDIRVWRRPINPPVYKSQVEKQNLNSEANGRSQSDTKYEYRVCGRLNNISALSFLEVQLNLAYRHKWDSRVVDLDYLTHNDLNCNDFTAIRWIVSFPFPLADREYIYLRRWWLEPSDNDKSAIKHSNSFSNLTTKPVLRSNIKNDYQKNNHLDFDDNVSFGRRAFVISRSYSPPNQSYSENSSQTANYSSRWSNPLKQNLVQVRDYHSEMFIESHGNFDQPGFDYYLIYYDDPCLPIKYPALSMFSAKALDHFMTQLQNAASELDRNGLPTGIDPVIFHPRYEKQRKLSELSPVLQNKDSLSTLLPSSIQSTETTASFPSSSSSRTATLIDNSTDSSEFSSVGISSKKKMPQFYTDPQEKNCRQSKSQAALY